MKLKEALRIVHALAEGNALDLDDQVENILIKEARRQRAALDVVSEHIDTLLD